MEQVAGLEALQAEFWTRIYLPVMIWLVIVIILVGGLVIKYPFGKWTKENPNPYDGETLSLPRGVFRSLLTLTLLFVTVMFELSNLYAGHSSEQNFYEWIVAFQMMIAFYFGSKVMHHVTSADQKKAAVEADKTAAVLSAQSMMAQSSTAVGEESDEFGDEEAAG